MHEAMFFLNPNEELDRESFEDYRLNEHAPLAHDTPGVERYTVSFTEGDADYEGVAELWFEDRGTLRDALESDAFTEVQKDVPNFADPNDVEQYVVEEHVVEDG